MMARTRPHQQPNISRTNIDDLVCDADADLRLRLGNTLAETEVIDNWRCTMHLRPLRPLRRRTTHASTTTEKTASPMRPAANVRAHGDTPTQMSIGT